MHHSGPIRNNQEATNTEHPYRKNTESPRPILDLCTKKKMEAMRHALNNPSPSQSPVHQQTPTSPSHSINIPDTTSECSEDSELSKSTTDAITHNPHQTYPCSENSTSPNTVTEIEEHPNNDIAFPRPFKAFPNNPLGFSLNFLSRIEPVEVAYAVKSTEPDNVKYEEFRQRMLAQVQNDNGSNQNMRRYQTRNNADPMYLEKRKKNNEAAKKSRDARKAREDEVAIRCAFLEQENLKLRAKIAAVEADTQRLKSVILCRKPS